MKDLILITAYCPDDNRLNKLRNLVRGLCKFKDEVDIMIVSHSSIPVDIQKNVNLCLFDDKNELLTDWGFLNQPFFDPNKGGVIQSGLLTNRNTQLAIWRMLILGLSLAKNVGYKKVHVVEYDCEIKNINEIKENSDLLNTYNCVYYMDRQPHVREILFGSTQSYLVEGLHENLLNLNEDKIKHMIRSAASKSPEGMLQNLIHEVGDYFVKDSNVLDTKGNKFATSNDEDGFNPWGVPFINLCDNKLQFIAWNQKKDVVNYKIIVNDEVVIKLGNILRNNWGIANLGKMDDVFKIITIEDDVIRDIIKLDSEGDKKLFKNISFRNKQ
tara:strand:- start:18 stop:998 length:981 start_codon:yes stop_codon:yes gene_type:complete